MWEISLLKGGSGRLPLDKWSQETNQKESGESNMKVIEQVSKDLGINPEVLVANYCSNDYRENLLSLCDSSCEDCWNQEDTNVLATVTDEEVERIKNVKDKLKEARKLSVKAGEMATEAHREKEVWFEELGEKYGIKGNFRFDPDTKTLQRIEKTDERAAISKVIGMLLGGLKGE